MRPGRYLSAPAFEWKARVESDGAEAFTRSDLMQKKMQRFGGFALSALAAAMLAACGGGGSSSALEETSGSSGTTTEAPAAPAPTVTKTAVTLSGVVATGAAARAPRWAPAVSWAMMASIR